MERQAKRIKLAEEIGKELQGVNYFSKMPKDIVCIILSRCEIRELLTTVSRVCKTWRSLVEVF